MLAAVLWPAWITNECRKCWQQCCDQLDLLSSTSWLSCHGSGRKQPAAICCMTCAAQATWWRTVGGAVKHVKHPPHSSSNSYSSSKNNHITINRNSSSKLLPAWWYGIAPATSGAKPSQGSSIVVADWSSWMIFAQFMHSCWLWGLAWKEYCLHNRHQPCMGLCVSCAVINRSRCCRHGWTKADTRQFFLFDILGHTLNSILLVCQLWLIVGIPWWT